MQLSDTKINFFGDKVSWDRSGAVASLLYRKDIFAFAFAVVAVEVCAPPNHFWRTLLISCAANAGTMFIERLCEYVHMDAALREVSKRKCIETKPDHRTPPTLDKWGLSAKQMQRYFIKSIFITALSLTLLSAPYAAMIFPVLLTRLFEGLHRWHKVIKGYWVIGDKGPPSDPVKKPSSGFHLNPPKLDQPSH